MCGLCSSGNNRRFNFHEGGEKRAGDEGAEVRGRGEGSGTGGGAGARLLNKETRQAGADGMDRMIEDRMMFPRAGQFLFCKLVEHQTEGGFWFSMLR